MEKTKKRKSNFINILTWIVILLAVLGIVKSVEMTKGFIKDKPEIKREITIAEVNKITAKSKNNEVKTKIEYYSNYMEDFKKLDIELTEEEQEFLYILSKDYDISYPLALGIIDLESNFKKDIISPTDDYGLMQINKINHEWLKNNLGFEDMLNPYNNMRSGMFIIADLFDKYDTEEEVLMSYNMGEKGASRLWDKGVYNTKYSRKILKNKKKYEEMLK